MTWPVGSSLAAIVVLLLLLPAGPAGRVDSPIPPLPAPVPQTDEPDHAFMPGQVLVRLQSWAAAGTAERIARAHGFRVSSAIGPLGTYLLSVPEGHEAAALAALRDEPEVAWVQLDGLGRAMLVPDDAFYRPTQWNLRQIGMEAAWDITRGDGKVVVAVLDTGVDLEHPELAPNLVPGYDFVHDDPVPEDDSSHGTHTAGIIAARGNNGQGIAGIAWEARIMPIKVLNARGLGPESAMIRGLVYAVDQGARIINLSSGTTRGSAAMAEAVAYAYRKGALLVTAAGNSGDRGNPSIYPAAYPEVIAVGATDRSNVAPPFSQRQSYVTVVAPGVDIPSAAWEGAGIGRYAMATGTSAAAPHVAGLAALIWSLEPDLTNDQVRRLIVEHADDLGPPGRDETYGYGLINAARTLAALRPQPATAAPSVRPPGTGTPARATPTSATPTALQTLPTLAPLPTPAPLPRAPSDWYFAEGSTRPPFDTWLHLLNPNPEPAEARITYLLTEGPAKEQRLTVPPNARASVLVNQVVPAADFSIRVRAETTVLVERAMFFGHDGHVTGGVASPSTTWYLAEGASTPPYDTWILLQNPNPRAVTARLGFTTADGWHKDYLQLLPPNARRSIYGNLLFQAEGFSTIVQADAPIVAERAMYFDGARGGHDAVGVNAPAKTWYLAEGSTRPGFETWLIFQNPGDAPAEVRVRYLREQGDPVESFHSVPARGRARISVGELLADYSFGAAIESSVPIVVERAMYFGDEGRGGHIGSGVATPSVEWYLAEGSTKPPFEEFLAVLNPNVASVDLELSLLPAGGGEPQVRLFQMRPESRLTLDLNRLAPNGDYSARLRATKPIVVERSMYFANGTGGTNAAGMTR
ncbi:MAG: S8 family serine peptidase [Chloroflexi bacterium]|nr:S8 family serine peptidase [Chloroflexota bacterium]